MQSARILIIENNDSDRIELVQNLQSWGHYTQSASTAEKGLEIAHKEPFDMVICNIDLPHIDGIDMIEQIQSYDPVIISMVITNKTDQAIAIRALESGAKSFLPKPFSKLELEEKLEHALKQRKKKIETRLLIGDLIRNRNKLQVKIAEREKFLDHLIDAAPFAIYATGQYDQILTFNQKAQDLYGYTDEEVIGKPTQMLWEQTSPNQPISSKPHAIHLKKSGQAFPVYIQCRDIQNTEGQKSAHLYIVEDLSEREQMEDQLLYAERLSLLGQLAPRIAHEFKTPIQLISGQSELADMYLQKHDINKAQTCIEHIVPAVSKILDLVQQMLNLGKPTKHCEKKLDLLTELQNTLDPLQHLGTVKYCNITWEAEENLPYVQGDPNQIEQVFRNLIVNAAQAMEQNSTERKLTFRLHRHKKDPLIVVQIEDTGPGIPLSARNKIFQPFYTTKPEGEGTGLGLAIVKSILDRHNAYINVQSEEGKGTLFTLTFPIA